MKNEKIIVIDASEGTLGRIASLAAKKALLGYEVKVVNCEKAIIIGRRKNIIEEYIIKRVRGGSSQKGPHFPKSPEMLMKRTVRGMLSYKKGRGGDAFKRIMCYNGIPKEFEKNKKIDAKKENAGKSMTLNSLSGEI